MDAVERVVRPGATTTLVVGVGDSLGYFTLHQVAVLLKVIDGDLVRVNAHLKHFLLTHTLLIGWVSWLHGQLS